MYPDRELTQLAAYKAALRRNIAIDRIQCSAAATRVLQPFEWLDKLLVLWRRIAPLARFAVVPLGFVVKRTVFSRWKFLGSLVSWGPLVVSMIRRIGSAVTS